MRRFELCFRFADEDDRYLIADLLDKEEPLETKAFDTSTCLNFEYRYPVLPEGLLPRFLVRTHVLSRKQPRWRTGVILSFEGNRACVRADKVEKRVVIAVDGPAAGQRRLLAIVRYNFEFIHQIYTFQPEEVVPIPGHPEVCIPYKKLLVLEENRIDSIAEVVEVRIGDQVKHEVLTLDVKDLLNGVDLEGNRRRDAPVIPLDLFYSYAHKDEELRDEMATHLILFERQGLIKQWHDRRIQAGEEWKGEIDEHIERADVILLMVSSDFIASSYCYDIELSRALERHREGSAQVIPIIVRDCKWEIAPFKHLQILPTDGRAVTLWGSDKYVRDAAWRNVADGIEAVLRKMIARKEHDCR